MNIAFKDFFKKLFFNILGFGIAFGVAIALLFGILGVAKEFIINSLNKYVLVDKKCSISTNKNNFFVLKCENLDLKNRKSPVKEVNRFKLKGKNVVLKLKSNFKVDLEIDNLDLELELTPSEKKEKGIKTFKSAFVQRAINSLNLKVNSGVVKIIYGKDKIRIENINLKLHNGNIETKKPIKIVYNDQYVELVKLKGVFKDNIFFLHNASIKLPDYKQKNLYVKFNEVVDLKGKYDFSEGKLELESLTDGVLVVFKDKDKDIKAEIDNIKIKTYIEDNLLDLNGGAISEINMKLGENRFRLVDTQLALKYKQKDLKDNYSLNLVIPLTEMRLGEKFLYIRNINASLVGTLKGKNRLVVSFPVGKIKDFAKLDTTFYLKNNQLADLSSVLSIYGLGEKVIDIKLKKDNLNILLSRINIDGTLKFLNALKNSDEFKEFDIKSIYNLINENKKSMSNFYILGRADINLKTKNIKSNLEIGDIANKYIKEYLNINKVRAKGQVEGNIDKRINVDFTLFGDNKSVFQLKGYIDKLKYTRINIKSAKPIGIKANKDTYIQATIKELVIKGELGNLKIDTKARIKEIKYKKNSFKTPLDLNLTYLIKEGLIKTNITGEGIKGDIDYKIKDNNLNLNLALNNYPISTLEIEGIPKYIKPKRLSLNLTGDIKIKKEVAYNIKIKDGIVNLGINKLDENGKSSFRIDNVAFRFDGNITNKDKQLNITTRNNNLKIYLSDKEIEVGKLDLDLELQNNKLYGNYLVSTLKEKNQPILEEFSTEGDLELDLDKKKLELTGGGNVKQQEISLKYEIFANGNIGENLRIDGDIKLNSSTYSKYIDKNTIQFSIYNKNKTPNFEANSTNINLHIKDYKVALMNLNLKGKLQDGIKTEIDGKNLKIIDKYNMEVIKIPTLKTYMENEEIYIKEPINFYGLVKGKLEKFRYNISKKTIDIILDGLLNSDLLSQFIVFGIVKGDIKIYAEYKGNIQNFPKGIYAQITADKFVFKNRFIRDRLVSKKLVLTLKDGILSADIYATSDTNQKLDLKLIGKTEFRKLLENQRAVNKFDITGKNISIKYKSIFRGKVDDTDIKVVVRKGQTTNKNKQLEQIKSLNIDVDGKLLFSGRIHVNREFIKEFVNKDKKRVEKKKNPLIEELKKHINLSINIRTTNPLLIYGNFGDAYMSVNIYISGNLEKPIVNGELNFVYGKINLFGIKYNVDYFNVIISGNKPFINARLATMIKDTIIRITIYSTYDQPEVIISSIPPKPQRELLAMLFFKDITSAVGNLTTGMLPLFRDIGALLRAILPSEEGREETEGIFNTGIEVSITPEYSPTEGLIPFVNVKRPLTKRFYIAVSKALIQNENLTETGWFEFGTKLTERTLFRYRKFDSGIIDYGFTITTQFDF